MPEAGCRTPAVPGKASLIVKDWTSDTRDRLLWKWLKGSVTVKADFGNPSATTDYQLCIYDGTPSLIASATAPGGALCNVQNPRPCWTETSRGFKYADRDLTDGLQRILLKEGLGAGRAKIVIKAKGGNLAMPVIPIAQPVTVHLKNSAGVCWEAVYSAPARTNATGPPAQFRDKAD